MVICLSHCLGIQQPLVSKELNSRFASNPEENRLLELLFSMVNKHEFFLAPSLFEVHPASGLAAFYWIPSQVSHKLCATPGRCTQAGKSQPRKRSKKCSEVLWNSISWADMGSKHQFSVSCGLPHPVGHGGKPDEDPANGFFTVTF